MSTLLEKLDKGKLIKTISNVDDPEEIYNFIQSSIKNKTVIPETILNEYLKNSRLFTLKRDDEDYNTQTINVWVKIWSTYAENLIEKNIEIPKIVLEAISKSIEYSGDIISFLIMKKKHVPDVILYSSSALYATRELIALEQKIPDFLFKAISKSPENSYWFALDLMNHGKEIPDLLLTNLIKSKNPFDDNLRNSLKDHLEKRGMKVPDILKNGLEKESAIVNEKLDKEELKKSFFKNPHTTFNYVKKRFLNKNEFPPEEFINAIAQSPNASKNYIHFVYYEMGHYNFKPPKILLQSVLQNGDMSLNLLKARYGIENNDFDSDFPSLESISDQDLLKSIVKESYLAFAAYQIYKKKGIKIPLNLWKSILSSPTASLYVAREFLKDDQPIPEAIIKGVASKVENAFVFAFDLLRKNVDLPETLLKTLAENADMGRIEHNFDNLLITYVELRKEIPEILINGAANKKWRDTDLSNLCLKFARKGLKIPDKILDVFIEKTPKHGVTRHLGKVSYDILNKYIEYAPWNLIYRADKEAFKIIPSKLYQYIITPDLAGVSQTKNLIRGFLTNFNKIPEDFRQAIIDNYKEYGHEIPKDIADAAGIKQSETINEKLNKDELLDAIVKDADSSYGLIVRSVRDKREFPEVLYKGVALDPSRADWEAARLIQNKKNVPDILIKSIASKAYTSLSFAKGFWATYDREPPKIIVRGIAKSSEYSLYYARYLMELNKDIPEIISKGISKNYFSSALYANELIEAGREVPDIILKTHPDISARLQQQYEKPIEEKLDKKQLLNSLLNPEDYDESIDGSNWSLIRKLQWEELSDLGLRLIKNKGNLDKHIIDNFFAKSGTNSYYFIELLIKQLNARLYSDKNALNNIKNFLKNIPEDMVKKIAYTPSYSYYVADNFIFHNIKVPDLLLISISKHPQLSSKLNNLYDIRGEEVPEIIANAITKKSDDPKTITEKLDKEELLGAVIKDKYQVNQLVFNFATNNKKIPEKLAEYISQNWNPSNLYQIATDIIRYSNYDVPEMILQGIAKSNSLSNETALLYKNHYLEIPDVIMNALTPKQKEFYSSVWFSTQKPITEKLYKNELLNVAASDDLSSHSLISSFVNMEDENLLINFLKNLPENFIKNIAEEKYFSDAYTLAHAMVHHNINVPDILLKAVSKNPDHSIILSNMYSRRGKTVPEIIANAIAKKSDDPKTITEKLDKGDLLGVIQKDYEGFIQIMDFYFRKKKEYPPEEFLKMAVETDEASRIFAEYCLEMREDIPNEVIEKVAENPRSAYTIAALMILEERKVPEILIKSINSDPISQKHFEQFIKNRWNTHIPTSYYAKI